MKFKSKRLPSIEVRISSNRECLLYKVKIPRKKVLR
jgi:hypothetical protein